jgi:DNA polymerase (family 10)
MLRCFAKQENEGGFMPVTNAQIAEIFGTVADILEMENENQFRIRAYRTAAMTVASFGQSFDDIISRGQELPKLSGIGKDIEGKIIEIVRTGKLKQLVDLQKQIPAGLIDLLKLPGLGPKRVKILYDKLGVKTFDALEKAAKEGKIEKIAGFGEKSQQHIIEQIEQRKGIQRNITLASAEEAALPLIEYLKKIKGVKKAEAAGSFRRRKETIGDLDILVICSKAETVMEKFTAYSEVREVVGSGPTKSTVVLKSGLQVDVRVVPQESSGAAMVYFTGSKAHNIAIRKIGVKKKLKVNEYGVFKGNKSMAGKTEEDVYTALGLAYIEPELREDRGEVAAAQKGTLPKLITIEDIRGDLHVHTTATDGRNSLEEIAEAARARGYEYIAITDHTANDEEAGGLDAKAMRKRLEAIDKFASKMKGLTILKSAEVDILEDGKLDLPDEVLKELDVSVCAVHEKFLLPRDRQTKRLLTAMDNPYFNILAHPTCRMINERPPCEIDLEKILKAASQRGCIVECDSQPKRLDLADIYLKMAKEMGVKIVISTDGHSVKDLDNMRLGVAQARRGWLTAADVINTKSLAELEKLLKRSG